MASRHPMSVSHALVAVAALSCWSQLASASEEVLPLPGHSLPARLLLTDRVSVDPEGDAAEAARAMLAPLGWEYLLSSPDGVFGTKAKFSVKGLPLWQALDQLMDVYGYDWGVREGAVVCWQGLLPPRPRPEPGTSESAEAGTTALALTLTGQLGVPGGPVIQPAAPAPERDGTKPFAIAPEDRFEVAFREPATFPQWLAAVERADTPSTRGATAWYASYLRPEAVSSDFGAWRIVGRTLSPFRTKMVQRLCAVLGATWRGQGTFARVTPGPHVTMDRAFRRAHEMKDDGSAALPTAELHRRIREALLLLVSEQQFGALIRDGTPVQVPFGDLPAETAALVLIAMERSDQRPDARPSAPVDWFRPDQVVLHSELVGMSSAAGSGDPARRSASRLEAAITCVQTDGIFRLITP